MRTLPVKGARRSSEMAPEFRSVSKDKFELNGPKMSINSSKNSTAMAKITAKTSSNNGPEASNIKKAHTTVTDHNCSSSIGTLNKTQGADEKDMRFTNVQLPALRADRISQEVRSRQISATNNHTGKMNAGQRNTMK